MLVTGGAGFLGERLVAALLARGHPVTVVDDLSNGLPGRLNAWLGHPSLAVRRLDVADGRALRALVAARSPFAALVHLAARVGVRRVLADPDGCRRSSARAARALVEALAVLPRAERPRVFAASSSEVYRPSVGPLREGSPLRSVRDRGRWAYAAGKLLAEGVLDRADWASGREPVHLRLFNVVGPGQDARTGMVLPTFVEQALAGGPLTVHGTGDQRRSFAHVDDVAATLCALIEAPDLPSGPLNVGGGAECSVLELAHAVLRAASGRRPAVLVHVDPRCQLDPGFEEVRERAPCLERCRRHAPGTGARSLEAIVADTVARHVHLRRGARAPFLGELACASPAS